jgi:NDP-sugar pyrophosphorylase family protein
MDDPCVSDVPRPDPGANGGDNRDRHPSVRQAGLAVATVGVIPAAGHATRLQPLECSKEVYPIHGRPVMDYLIERMRRGGCSELRVVTRPGKRDVVATARGQGATVIQASPPSPAASLLAGIDGLHDDDVVLFGYPDSIWEPPNGFRPLVELVEAGSEVALGLFRTSQVERPDVVDLNAAGTVTRIEVASGRLPPHLIWGCAAARAPALRGLEGHQDPGDYLSALCRAIAIAGVILSDSYIDIGTRHGLREAVLAPRTR